MTNYTVHHEDANIEGNTIEVLVDLDDIIGTTEEQKTALAIAAAVAKTGVDETKITKVHLGWIVETKIYDKEFSEQFINQVNAWDVMNKKLGLEALRISMDGFEPDSHIADIDPRTGTPYCDAGRIMQICLSNGGYRFKTIHIPAKATYGEAAQAMDTHIRKHMPDHSSFLEIMRPGRYDAAKGVLTIDVFIGS